MTNFLIRLLASIGIVAFYSLFIVMSKPFPWSSGFMPAAVIQQEYIGWIAFSILCGCGGLISLIAIWRLK